MFDVLAKKAKKKKGKTLALTEFLADDGENGSSSVSHAAVFSARSTSWADESEELNTEGMNSVWVLIKVAVVLKKSIPGTYIVFISQRHVDPAYLTI